jgi:DNA-binding Xre family transcriptional regulator
MAKAMRNRTKFTVERRTAPRVRRTAAEIAELKAVREQFQRDKPALADVLAATGQTEAVPLGEYLQTQELLARLRQERARQKLTLSELGRATGIDPAVLSRLFTGRQANTTLATLARIANALGKEVVHSLRDLPQIGRRRAKRNEDSLRRKRSGRKAPLPS